MSKQGEYKDTEIGRIPKEWEIVKLGDDKIVNLIMGQSPSSSTYNVSGIGLPFLQGNADFGEIYPNPKVFCSEPIKIAEKNDILLSVRAPVGDVNINPFKSCIGRGLSAIKPNYKNVNHMFLFYCLKFLNKLFKYLSSGSTFKAIRKSDIENFKLPLPPLPEQKKIAEILSTVDDAIEKVDEAISKTERLKKGLMQELLKKGIGHKEFKDTEIGRIPKEWKVVEIKHVGKVLTGKTPPTIKETYWNGNIPFITPEDLKGEKYIIKTNRYITLEGKKHSTEIIPPYSVLVVCIGSTIGKVALTKTDSVTNQQINSIICKDDVNPEYIYYAILLRSFVLKYFSGVAAVPIIKKSLFEKIKIPLPEEISEQKKIAEILSTVDKRIELLKKKKEILNRIKKGLMNDLLTGRRRVKL